MRQPTIALLARKDIDTERWDAAVRSAPYGLSWWLDAATGGRWYGLVLDGYRAVLPLPVSRSLGPVKLINGASFTQHQGPFGTFSGAEALRMLRAIPPWWYVRKLSFYPPTAAETDLPSRWRVTPRTNHELDLSPDYPTLVRGYRGNLRRKLRDFPPTELNDWPLPDFLAFYQEHAGAKAGLTAASYKIMKRLTAAILRHKAGNCYHLTDEAGATIAALLLVHHGNRCFNLLAASSPEGYRLHGMTRLLDGVVRAHAGTPTVLDFEGSDIPGVALFFRGFGAERVVYASLGRSLRP